MSTMAEQSLKRLFDELEAPIGEGAVAEAFNSQLLPGISFARIGKDPQGRPALLLSLIVEPGFEGINYSFSNLGIKFRLRCLVTSASGEQTEESLCVIRCRADASDIQGCFLQVMGAFVESLPRDCTERAAADSARSLIDLFESLSLDKSGSAQGLWSELYLIWGARDPVTAMEAWHPSPESKVDFVSGAELVEAKSSTSGEREHSFSFEQANPPPACRLIIASMLVEESVTGTSIDDLRSEISEMMTGRADLQLKLQRIALKTLGRAWEQSLHRRFSTVHGAAGLSFFDVEAIPRISGELPVGVSDVRFRASLDGSPAVAPESVGDGGLFSAIMRRRSR
jgi:hypothetical protein